MSHDVYKLFAQYDPALVDLFPFAYEQLNMPTVEEQQKAGLIEQISSLVAFQTSIFFLPICILL